MDTRTRHERNQRLTMLIGGIVRADVVAEDAARGVWYSLAGDGPAQMVIPRDFARVLQGCREMLRVATFDEHTMALALSVLSAAGSAHDIRSKLAHDQWLIREDGNWRSGKTAQRLAAGTLSHPRDLLDDLPPRGLDEFERALTGLQRVYWRLTALERVIVSGEPATKADRENREFDASLMRDDFHMSTDGLSVFL